MYTGKREKKKPTNDSGEWRRTLTGILVDFFVGLALLLIDHLVEHLWK